MDYGNVFGVQGRGRNQHGEHLAFAEAKHRKQKCQNCNGAGFIMVEGKRVTCGVCGGSGTY